MCVVLGRRRILLRTQCSCWLIPSSVLVRVSPRAAEKRGSVEGRAKCVYVGVFYFRAFEISSASVALEVFESIR